MYPNAQERACVDAAGKLMVEVMARYDPSHDAHHVQRVRKIALALARTLTPTPDLLTIELAALLHDVLDRKYVTPEQTADAYGYFLPFFRSLPLDLVADGRAKTIARVVENVSWTTEVKLRTSGEWGAWHDECKELHCVQDADRLDAIGAIGVMRCSAYSAVIKRALYAPLGGPEENDTAIEHFHEKLFKVKDRLKTDAGRQMGEKRHKLMLDFVAAIEEECNP